MTEIIIIKGCKYWWYRSNLNHANYDQEYLLFCIVMTSTQRPPHTVRNQLNEDNKKQAILKESSLISFLSIPRSRTSYHARTYWLMYQINLVTWVPVGLQQKNQYRSQQSAWPSNCSDVWCLHLVWQMVTLLSCFWFFVL